MTIVTPVSTSFKTEWWTQRLAGPVIAAAVVRLALLGLTLARTGTVGITMADTASYLIPGRNLLLHGQFVADGVPDMVRTPGYALFLAITSLAGLPAAALANIILSLFSIVLVWKLGRAVFGDDRIALGAAWIFAFEPMSVLFSISLMSETLFLLLFLLSMERLAEFLRGRRLRVLAVAGLWLAAATFVRPVTYYLPVPLALGIFVVLARERGLRWKAPAVLLISALPWLAAWQLRNWVETGYSGFSSIADASLYFVNDVELTARLEHHSSADVMKELGYSQFTGRSGQMYLAQPYVDRHPEQAGWNQTQRLAFMHTESLRVIRANSGLYLRTCLKGLFTTVFSPGVGYYDRLVSPIDPGRIASLVDKNPVSWERELARTHPWTAAEKAAFVALLLAMYLFAARGLFRADRHNACLWLLLGTALYFLAISGATGGLSGARYRIPVMPAVCILAAAGIQRKRTIAR